MKRLFMLSFWSGFLVFFFLLTFIGCAPRKGTLSQTDFERERREMRAAWWPTVWRDDYKEKSAVQLKQLFVQRIDRLDQIGINTVVFQVRSEADAFYASKYEPWSRVFTGMQGF